MSINPYESPDMVNEVPERWVVPWKRRLMEVLTVLGVLGLATMCVLPNFRMARPSARRSECASHLKQIAIALHNYMDVHESLPPAYTVDEDGRPLHSWRTLILPYLEQKQLYDTIDLTKPWNDPANKAAFEKDLQAYRCPSADHEPGRTTYLAVSAPNACFHGAETRSFADITDGTSLTLMVIEVSSEDAVPWMSPHDASFEAVLNFTSAKNPPHPGGAQAAMADGSILYLRKDLKAEVLQSLISINGNDNAIAEAVSD